MTLSLGANAIWIGSAPSASAVGIGSAGSEHVVNGATGLVLGNLRAFGLVTLGGGDDDERFDGERHGSIFAHGGIHAYVCFADSGIAPVLVKSSVEGHGCRTNIDFVLIGSDYFVNGNAH